MFHFPTSAAKESRIMLARIDYKEKIDALKNSYSQAEITAAENGAENAYSIALASLLAERDSFINTIQTAE
jgi:ribonuclease HIII